MQGMRPITRLQVKNLISITPSVRERALICIGFCTGFRISELRSLTLKDVVTGKAIHNYITVKASNTKTKQGRTQKINSDAIKAIKDLIEWLKSKGLTDKSTPLFLSQKKTINNELKAISRQQAYELLKALFAKIGEVGNVATHTMRKTFAANIYETTGGKIERVQAALGHKSINSTICYLSFNNKDIDDAVDQISLF